MRLIAFLSFLLLTFPAQAQVSQMYADQGLSASEADLANRPDPTPDELFALGTTRFLRGIERTLQTRWQSNASPESLSMMTGLPILRLPVPPNPDPIPFDPALITVLFGELLEDMAASRLALAAIPDEADPALTLDLLDIWFDINMNATRDRGEGLVEFSSLILGVAFTPDTTSQLPSGLKVRFDASDVAWLTAYTELLSGFSELVIAFDPTEPISRVLKANAQMTELLGDTTPVNAMDMQFGHWVDQFAMVYGALNQQPDQTHTKAAHTHFLNMIAANKTFWSRLSLETDDTLEWIPNPNQTAALGFEMPAETGPLWQDILADAEAILNGQLLLPYWRVTPAGGINVNRVFNEPPVVDIVDWIQGSGLVPYLERGPTVSSQSVRQFEALLSGRALMFSFMLN